MRKWAEGGRLEGPSVEYDRGKIESFDGELVTHVTQNAKPPRFQQMFF